LRRITLGESGTDLLAPPLSTAFIVWVKPGVPIRPTFLDLRLHQQERIERRLDHVIMPTATSGRNGFGR
jgi:hypothetical protein